MFVGNLAISKISSRKDSAEQNLSMIHHLVHGILILYFLDTCILHLILVTVAENVLLSRFYLFSLYQREGFVENIYLDLRTFLAHRVIDGFWFQLSHKHDFEKIVSIFSRSAKSQCLKFILRFRDRVILPWSH